MSINLKYTIAHEAHDMMLSVLKFNEPGKIDDIFSLVRHFVKKRVWQTLVVVEENYINMIYTF